MIRVMGDIVAALNLTNFLIQSCAQVPDLEQSHHELNFMDWRGERERERERGKILYVQEQFKFSNTAFDLFNVCCTHIFTQ